MERFFTTPAGMRRLHARVAEALARYDEVIAQNPEAAEGGDNCVWHDNFAYEENQRRMHATARQVVDLRRLVQRAEVIGIPSVAEQAGIGTWVEIAYPDERTERWTIAGYEDGDPRAGRVSYTAPLARALLGARQGDVRVVATSGKRVEVVLMAVGSAGEEG